MTRTSAGFALSALLLLPWSAGAYDNISLAGEAAFKKTLTRAGSVAAAPSGDWLVSDAGKGNVQVFTSAGKPKAVIGVKGKGADQLDQPLGVAVDAAGNVYVADAGRDRVAVYAAGGKFLRSLGVKGSEAGQLKGPVGVAVTHDGVVYVADAGNSRVQVFSADGVFLLGFGGPGDGNGLFKNLAAVAVGPAGRVYVLDESRVQIFTPAGQFINLLLRPKADPKDKAAPAPKGLAADAFGAVYVAGEHQKIEEYGPDGKYIASFGTFGNGAGQFKGLSALAAAPGGVVLALDEKLDRVQGFKIVSAGRTETLAPAPTLRFSVKTLETRGVVVDDFAFLGDTLVGLTSKTAKLSAANRRGADAPKALGAGKGKSLTQLNSPAGVSAGGGKIWIADAGNERVLSWTADGQAASANAVGSGGKREGQFKNPAAVAVDGQGRLVVADPDMKRVQVFSADGIFLRSLPGAFQTPVDVAPLPANGVAVLDAGKKALFTFDDNGRPVDTAEGFTDPASIATDPRGTLGFVYVMDKGSAQVKVVSGSKVVASFGSPSLFTGPKAISVDDRGAVWVADAQGLKAFEVRLTPLEPRTFTAKPGESEISLAWTKDAENMAGGYRLYRSTRAAGGGGSAEPYRVFTATETSFLDREIVPGLTYHYGLAALALDAEGKHPLEGPRAADKAVTERPANLPPVDFASITFEKLFSSQYKYYEKNPVGRVTIKNNTEKTFQKIRVGFSLQNYMDFVTEKVIDRFEPGALETLELKATFNNKVLSVTEDTPIQAQISLTYYDNGEEKVFKRAEPLTMYSRNALSWEDPRRLGTFITAKDPAVLEFARGPVGAFQKEIEAGPVNPNLAKAAVVFESLGALGITYLKDPTNPFSRVSENVAAIDYVQYPRETLRRKTGDCDDLTALTMALLESVSVPTAVLDVPGHVLLAFQVDDSYPLDPGLPADALITRDGERWVPLEATYIGKSLGEAIDQAAKVVRNTPEDRLTLVDARDAWAAYAPATLPEEPGIVAPKKDEITAKFPAGGVKALSARRLDALTERYQAQLKENPKNTDARLQLGLTRAEHGLFDESAADFDAVLKDEPKNAAALNDRANVYWVKGDAAKARDLYAQAAAADEKDAGVRVNLARAAWKAGDKPAARKALADALTLDPSLKKNHATVEELVK